MKKWNGRIAGLIAAVACASSAGHAQDPALLGTWNLIDVTREVVGSGERTSSYGPNPDGVIIFTPEGRVVALVTPAWSPGPGAKPPSNYLAFTGMITAQSPGKFTYQLDVTVNASPKGVDRQREYTITGDRLDITLLPIAKRDDGKEVKTVLSWRRGK